MGLVSPHYPVVRITNRMVDVSIVDRLKTIHTVIIFIFSTVIINTAIGIIFVPSTCAWQALNEDKRSKEAFGEGGVNPVAISWP